MCTNSVGHGLCSLELWILIAALAAVASMRPSDFLVLSDMDAANASSAAVSQDCPRDTGGTCRVFGCSGYRNSHCDENKHCMCKLGSCAVHGTCDKDGCHTVTPETCYVFGCRTHHSRCQKGKCVCEDGYCLTLDGECKRRGCTSHAGNCLEFGCSSNSRCNELKQCICLRGYCSTGGMCEPATQNFKVPFDKDWKNNFQARLMEAERFGGDPRTITVVDKHGKEVGLDRYGKPVVDEHVASEQIFPLAVRIEATEMSTGASASDSEESLNTQEELAALDTEATGTTEGLAYGRIKKTVKTEMQALGKERREIRQVAQDAEYAREDAFEYAEDLSAEEKAARQEVEDTIGLDKGYGKLKEEIAVDETQNLKNILDVIKKSDETPPIGVDIGVETTDEGSGEEPKKKEHAADVCEKDTGSSCELVDCPISQNAVCNLEEKKCRCRPHHCKDHTGRCIGDG